MISYKVDTLTELEASADGKSDSGIGKAPLNRFINSIVIVMPLMQLKKGSISFIEIMSLLSPRFLQLQKEEKARKRN